jgi:hypothetical protein
MRLLPLIVGDENSSFLPRRNVVERRMREADRVALAAGVFVASIDFVDGHVANRSR